MLNTVINKVTKLCILYDILIRNPGFTYTYISHTYTHRKVVKIEKNVEIIGCEPNKISSIILVVTSGWWHGTQIIFFLTKQHFLNIL